MKGTAVPIVGAGNDVVAFRFQHLHSGQVHTLPFRLVRAQAAIRVTGQCVGHRRTVAIEERVIEVPLRVGKCCEEPCETGGDVLRCAMARAGCDIAVPTSQSARALRRLRAVG